MLLQRIKRGDTILARAQVVVVAITSAGKPARMPPAVRARFGG
jgi:acyl-CoA thioesterase FadM